MHNQYSEAKEMHKEWEKRHLCIMTPGGIKTETGGIDPLSPCQFNFKAIGRLVSKCHFFVTPTFG